MEQIQFQQMAQRNAQAQKFALELFKSGQKMKAVELLTDQLSQIELLQLSPEVDRGPARLPMERRLSEFRTVMAQDLLTNQRQNNKALAWDENKYQNDIRKRQDEVADLMKQCQALQPRGQVQGKPGPGVQGQGARPRQRGRQHRDPDDQHPRSTSMRERPHQGRGRGLLRRGARRSAPAAADRRRPVPDDRGGTQAAPVAQDARRTSIIDRLRNPKERAIQYRLEQPIQFGFRTRPLQGRDRLD